MLGPLAWNVNERNKRTPGLASKCPVINSATNLSFEFPEIVSGWLAEEGFVTGS
jgi:hypothetical protein